MGETSVSALNKIYILLAIISLVISWMPSIEETYRIALLIVFIVLLIIIYYSTYFKAVDEIEEKMEILEKKIEKIEDLINIKSDIKLLKKVLKINE